MQRPLLNGEPVYLGDLFRLTKGRKKSARAALSSHELGWQLRLAKRYLRWEDPNLPGHAYVAGRKSKQVLRDLASKGRWVAGGRNWDSETPID